MSCLGHKCPLHTQNYFTNTDNLPVSAAEIKEATCKDPILSRVLNYTMNGWPKHNEDKDIQDYFVRRHELSTDQGCLQWELRVIIPSVLRARLVTELHQEHTGIVRMKAVARSYFLYPRLDQDIEETVKSCEVCLSLRNAPTKVPFVPWTNAQKPWERVHIDFFELEGTHYLIMIDCYSKWINVECMTSTTTAQTVEVLRSWFAIFGLPAELVSDNGPQFTSEVFALFLSRNGVRHTRVLPYIPASNGAAERSVQIAKKALKKYMLEDDFGKSPKVSVRHRLDNFLLSYRITPQSSTECSPYELLHPEHDLVC